MSQRIMRKESNQPSGLISVLLDKTARLDERDDAAMDLSVFDELEVEAALVQLVCDHKEDEMVADSAGESLYVIWKRKSKWDAALVDKMHPSAKVFFETRNR